jgi:2-methylcitrate dehydratase PrpD
VKRTKDLLLDHIGVSLYGASLKWGRILREQVLAEGGKAESTLYYGSARVPCRAAALVNGTAAHGVELDDTHDESLSHPGCVVIPAALAVAEAQRATGAVFLESIIAGYEAQCRIGSALGSSLVRKGFHPTAQLGVFGAAAAAGFVLRLPARQLDHAIGIAAAMSSGTMKFTEDAEGTMVKRLYGGMPAERGVLAACIASRGFTGPRDAIEGPFGFANVFASVEDVSRITRDLGERYEIDNMSIKLYPCCRHFHSLIEAIEDAKRDSAFSFDGLQTIETLGTRYMIDGHLERRPTSSMAAQYSLPYTTAVAMLSDVTNPDSFDDEATARPEVLALADRVVPTRAPDLEMLFPEKWASRVRLRYADNRCIERTVLDSRGTPARPIGRGDIERKFLSLTKGLLSPMRQEALIEAVDALDKAESVDRLTSVLGTDVLSEDKHPAVCD